MIINETIVKDLENMQGKPFAAELKKYLLVRYAQEPFPYEYSAQDLYANIKHDIRAYEAGRLDTTLKSPSKRCRQEREHLQHLYIEKCRKAREHADYVAELEQMLAQNGLESPRMARRRLRLSKGVTF